MNIIRSLVLAAIIISLFTGAVSAAPAAPEPLSAPGTDQLVVSLAPAAGPLPAAQAEQTDVWFASTAARLAAGAGLELAYLRQAAGGELVLKLPHSLPPGQAAAAAERLAQQPGVLRAEPDWILQPAADLLPAAPSPNDVYWPDLWGLEPYATDGSQVLNAGIDAPAAWAITYGDPNVLVAVLDTGILKQHEDLQGRYRIGAADLGWDMLADQAMAGDNDGRDADASDPGDYCGSGFSSWHGSHVAGTIGATGNNSLGVTGINWYSKLLPVRVLGRCGGYTSDIADGIRWAVGYSVSGALLNPYAGQVKVLNLSLGGQYACPYTIQTAIDAARARGVVVVAAAGNSAADAANFMPGSCSGVITVGAATRNANRASYSNFGRLVELSAPGGQMGAIDPANNNDTGIFSTIDKSFTVPQESYYGWMHGTSMAAPHVSGIVSLMFSANPLLTADQALMILQRTASPFAPTSPCRTNRACGTGIAHAGRAVQDAASFYWIEWPTANGRYGEAFAGDPAAPEPILIVTAAASNPRKTIVTIGGLKAAIKASSTANGRDYLTVQPAAASKSGRYDLQVTIDGALHTQPQAVFFGERLLVPVVVNTP